MTIQHFIMERAKYGWETSQLLLQLVLSAKGHGVTLFVKSNVIAYRCTSALLIEGSEIKEVLENSFELKVNSVKTEHIPKGKVSHYVKTPYLLGNSLLIPVIEGGESVIGYVLLWDNEPSTTLTLESITQDTLQYLSILQLICQRQKLLIDFEGLSKDNVSGMMKTLFLANVTHELRSPMQGIIGYSQFLTRTQLDITQQGYVQGLNKCTLHLMQIMNDILDFSKLSSGKMVKNEDIFQTKEIAQFVKDAMNVQFHEKKQVFRFTTEPGVPEWVIADKGKISQVLMNLLSNANKFTKTGGLVQVMLSNCANSKLMFTVTDNGTGISDTDQCKLFNCFTQLDNAKYTTGTGLGLYIAKKLCELLDGDIYVRSSLGKGTTFVFRVSYREYVSMKLRNEIIDDLTVFKDKHILVVDDNNDNRVLISQYLTDLGMIPVACSTALEASRIMFTRKYSFAAGLIDIHLGAVTGDDLAKMIREEFPFFKMIALSSYDSLLNAQLFEYKLEKPVNKNQLYNLLYTILKEEKKMETPRNKDYYIAKDEYTFLIVDDNSNNASIFVDMLQSLQYPNSRVFNNGKDFIDYFELGYDTPDAKKVIFLDLLMPVVNGIEVLRYLRTKNIDYPVVVLTASVMEEYKAECEKLGVDYFLNKPITISDLRKALATVLK